MFASAKNPGGGFGNGAQAQEESLAASSALYACQQAAGQFCTFHRHQQDPRYSDRIIYCHAGVSIHVPPARASATVTNRKTGSGADHDSRTN